MTLLTTGDVAWMQGIQERVMPGTVYILNMGTASDGMGGIAETWGTVGTVTGRIYPMVIRRGETEMAGGGQIISETQWFGTFPSGTSITARQRVRYGSRTWEVLRVNNSEMYQTAVRCELMAHNEEQRV
jgi:head-tail adaptor